jgi:hypothetical protein
MLEGITNINPDSAYKGDKKKVVFYPAVSRGNKPAGHGEDSISLSPSLHFLLEKNWNPVQLKEISSHKIFIDFILAGLEFKIDLDIDKVLLEKKFLYKVISSNETEKTKTLLQIEFKPSLDFLPSKYEAPLQNLSSLHALFGKVKEYNLIAEVNSIDADAVRNLLEGIEKGVINEFNHITSGVLQLYEKISGTNCNQLKISNENFSLVHILNITTVNN